MVTEDARAYVRRFEGKFDFIYSLSSNTFAAVASGSFAMAESYLFTTEAFQDYWRALSDDGFMMMEHQFYMPRLVASLIDALEAEGVDDCRVPLRRLRSAQDAPQHDPAVEAAADRRAPSLAFGELTEERFEDIHLLYPASPELCEDNLINQIVTAGWRAAAEKAPSRSRPRTDDRPFVGQMGRWQEPDAGEPREDDARWRSSACRWLE